MQGWGNRSAMPRLEIQGLRRAHLLADAVLVSLGWLAAYGLRYALDDAFNRPINPVSGYLSALPIVVGPWIFTCWLFGIYASQRMKTLVDELQRLLRGVALGLLVLAAVGFFVKELHFGRFVVLSAAGINLVLQGISRVVFHRIEKRMRRSGEHDVKVLIAGTGVAAIRLLQKLQDHPETGYRVVGFLDDSPDTVGKDVANRPVLGLVEELREVALKEGVSEIFVAMPSLGHTRLLSLVLECEDLGITFRVVTNLFEVLTAGSPLDLVDDLPLVQLGRDRPNPLYAPIKRALDLAGATLGLLLTGPILLACVWRIRRSGARSAFFAQTRIGLHGRPFTCYKLRTLREDADPYTVAPQAGDDPRITPVGRSLRRASLDELPQLWNVLRGEMSLVGPRPEMPFIVDRYDDWQRRRLTVKPGLTGLWQILGRKDLPMHENLQYDFYYIRNRGVALDLSILLRTIGAVLSRRGAF
jgi:exopolysaccharide biosynthesis polyprenyl glycosylphosphotransferase